MTKRTISDPPAESLRTSLVELGRARSMSAPMVNSEYRNTPENIDANVTFSLAPVPMEPCAVAESCAGHGSKEEREDEILAMLRSKVDGSRLSSEWHDAYEAYRALVHRKREVRRKKTDTSTEM